MKYKIIFSFIPDELSDNLSIGDILKIGYSYNKDEYFLYIPDGARNDISLTKKQILFAEEIEQSIKEFLYKKIGKENIMLWDNEYYDKLKDSYVRIEMISKDIVIVSIYDKSLVKEMNEYLYSVINSCTSLKDNEQSLKAESVLENEKKLEKEVMNKEEKEETTMFQEFGSSFGKINSNQFRLSINGLTVRGKDGKYLTFNPETKELIEVTTGFFDDMKDLLFLMPATELSEGDIILHQNKPYYITKISNAGVKGVDFEDAVESTIIPKTNVFGIKYFTKVFNCLGSNNILGTDMASNPMMAYALMGGKDFDLSKMMMFQALSKQEGNLADFSENPIMLMALMSNEKGGELSDFAKMQMLTQLSQKKKTQDKKEN